jgi:hypothetical protein
MLVEFFSMIGDEDHESGIFELPVTQRLEQFSEAAVVGGHLGVIEGGELRDAVRPCLSPRSVDAPHLFHGAGEGCHVRREAMEHVKRRLVGSVGIEGVDVQEKG